MGAEFKDLFQDIAKGRECASVLECVGDNRIRWGSSSRSPLQNDMNVSATVCFSPQTAAKWMDSYRVAAHWQLKRTKAMEAMG